jgi:outer membrane protein assembly factor BamD
MSSLISLRSNGWAALLSPAALLSLAFVLASCASPEPEIPNTPVEVLYNDAKDELQLGNARTAAKLFDEVERQHPYSKWATQAQLMSAYSYYLVDAYDDAIPALERFIELHRGNRNVAYALYLRALCYYEQIEDVTRDQGNTEDAQRALSDVIARFPNTPYARDATVKLDLVRDHLAGKEMSVGRYYQKRGHYLAAVNRYKLVVENFQTTSHVPEALERLVESYVALGMFAEAQRSGSVLGYNYPGSSWYIDAYLLLVNRGLTQEGFEAPPPVALAAPGAAPGATPAAATESNPELEVNSPDGIAPPSDSFVLPPEGGDTSAAP